MKTIKERKFIGGLLVNERIIGIRGKHWDCRWWFKKIIDFIYDNDRWRVEFRLRPFHFLISERWNKIKVFVYCRKVKMKKTIITQLENLPPEISKRNRILVRAQAAIRLRKKCKPKDEEND